MAFIGHATGFFFITSCFYRKIQFLVNYIRNINEKIRCLFFREFGVGSFVCLQTMLVIVCEHSNDSYLVDPASSHMLVSKIKPCMSKYKSILYLKLRIAH
jgi:hypothetical protein